jgi:pimeloyl-ACP methyl ester carboxylesterase
MQALPPPSLLLVHGAGSDSAIFDDWPQAFPRLRVAAVDLQEGIDVAGASMTDYAKRVVAAAGVLPQPVALCGWSMAERTLPSAMQTLLVQTASCSRSSCANSTVRARGRST